MLGSDSKSFNGTGAVPDSTLQKTLHSTHPHLAPTASRVGPNFMAGLEETQVAVISFKALKRQMYTGSYTAAQPLHNPAEIQKLNGRVV